jgi:hypothetical protein
MPFKKQITPQMVDQLKQRIENWNTTQGIKKNELGLLPNIWASQNSGMFRQRFYSLQGNETGLDQVSREQIVRLSRELFFQLPGVGVASEMKAEYTVGDNWDFKCKSKNPKINEAFETFINKKWYNNCSTKGFAMDFKTILKVASRTLDMDGDFGLLFVQNKQNYPLLQFIGSHRIGTAAGNMSGKDGVTTEINGKSYKILDGVVYDDMEKPIAYSIKRDDAQISTVLQDPKLKNKDQIIMAENMQLVYEPIVFDKGRGLPALYASVLYGLQVEDLDNFLMDVCKLESTIAYVVKNDAGQAPQEYENLLNQIQSINSNSNLSVSLPSVAPTVHGLSVVKGPTINYAKAEGGELQSFASDRPSEEIQSYIKVIETKLLSAIGIPHQLIYSPETISGRAVNAVSQMVKMSVRERQKILYRYAKLAVAFALSVGMQEGYIPEYFDEDLDSIIKFDMPPDFTLDSNADNSSNLERWKAGLMSAEEYCKVNNQDYTEVARIRKEETRQLLQDMTDLKKEFPNQNDMVILNILQQKGQASLKMEDQQMPEQPQNVLNKQ